MLTITVHYINASNNRFLLLARENVLLNINFCKTGPGVLHEVYPE